MKKERGRKSFSFEIGRACRYNKRVVRGVDTAYVHTYVPTDVPRVIAYLMCVKRRFVATAEVSAAYSRISIARADVEDGL